MIDPSTQSENLSRLLGCGICKKTVRVPVQFDLPSNSRGQSHTCYKSTERACLSCARRALMYGHPSNEQRQVQCPLCYSNSDGSLPVLCQCDDEYKCRCVDTSTIRRAPYHFDTRTADLITYMINEDLLPLLECDCGMTWSDQAELKAHIQSNECPENMTTCPSCKMGVKIGDLHEHQSSDRCCVPCPLCNRLSAGSTALEMDDHVRVCYLEQLKYCSAERNGLEAALNAVQERVDDIVAKHATHTFS